ncbi:MAG: hypothetical protein F4X95_03820 [Oligoflexia bacterium]|nr:hypothetical protein [Bdellovibrionales bacterium]MYE07860.1 hypothetical protein [Oligoflexia bacterium]
MELVIDLLQQKNNYLLQFEKMGSFECQRLRTGDYSHIEQFYYSRQIILDAIENIDIQIRSYTPQQISKEHKETIKALFQKKRAITKSILQQDITIHSYLNNLQYDVVEDQTA